jgi:hypothetical protein
MVVMAVLVVFAVAVVVWKMQHWC